MERFISQITFQYYDNLEKASDFFEKVLKLEKVYDPEWAVVYKVAEKAYIGAVDAKLGSIESQVRGGTLVSLTVKDVMPYYESIKEETLVTDVSDIKIFDDIGVKSFFFKGPDGYEFEIQEFTNPEIERLF